MLNDLQSADSDITISVINTSVKWKVITQLTNFTLCSFSGYRVSFDSWRNAKWTRKNEAVMHGSAIPNNVLVNMTGQLVGRKHSLDSYGLMKKNAALEEPNKNRSELIAIARRGFRLCFLFARLISDQRAYSAISAKRDPNPAQWRSQTHCQVSFAWSHFGRGSNATFAVGSSYGISWLTLDSGSLNGVVLLILSRRSGNSFVSLSISAKYSGKRAGQNEIE